MNSALLSLCPPTPAEQPGVQGAVWRAMRLAGVRLDQPGAAEVARSITWIVRQQPVILSRFPKEQNDAHTAEGMSQDAYWPQKLHKFIGRAGILTMDSPEGRQAVAELAATCIGLMASVMRVYGGPPERQPLDCGVKRE